MKVRFDTQPQRWELTSFVPSFCLPCPRGFFASNQFSRSLQITILEQEPITRSKKLFVPMQRCLHRSICFNTDFLANFDHQISLTNQAAKTGR